MTARGAAPDAEAATEADAGTAADAGTEADADAGTEADADAGTEAGTGASTGTGTGAGAGTGTIFQRVLAHRRRIATFAMVALLLLLVTHGSHVLPSTLELSIPLSAPSTITALEVTLLDEGGEEAHRLTRRFSGDAPEALELDASLLPGAYDVEVRVTRGDRTALLHGAVEVPSDGRVRVRLRE